jgi:tRNA-binding EMAP/Myf-like protein
MERNRLEFGWIWRLNKEFRVATITDVKDDTRASSLAVLTITMNDGTIVSKCVPKTLIDTEEKAKRYLTSLEKVKLVSATSPINVTDLAFLKGTKS